MVTPGLYYLLRRALYLTQKERLPRGQAKVDLLLLNHLIQQRVPYLIFLFNLLSPLKFVLNNSFLPWVVLHNFLGWVEKPALDHFLIVTVCTIRLVDSRALEGVAQFLLVLKYPFPRVYFSG